MTRASNSKEMYWTTEDGRKIAISMLEDSHLRNIIKFIRRNAEHYVRGAALRTQAIMMMFDDVPDSWFDTIGPLSSQEAMKVIERWPTWKALQRELKKRNLQEHTYDQSW